MRRIISGIAISLIATVFSLVVVEAGLRIAGSFYQKEWAAAKDVNKGAFLAYCFGDSFTYGIGSEDEKGYPEQLQELCKKQYPGKNIKIVNFGIPGSNSRQAFNYFKHILISGEYLKPNVVILMTGMNDWWNVADNNKVLSHRRMNPLVEKCYRALTHSKIFKLLTICFSKNTTIKKIDLSSKTAIADPDESGARERLGDQYLNTARVVFEENVNDAVNLARSYGVDIMFSQYPNGFIFDSSLESIAKKQNVAIIYNYARFKKALSDGQRNEYFSAKYSYSHPNEKGYAMMADETLATLKRRKLI